MASAPVPPPGYKLDPFAGFPSPPPGYTLNDFSHGPNTSGVPAFIQQGVDMKKVQQVPTADPEEDTEHTAGAYVDNRSPYDVHVIDPKFGKSDLNHELTHTFQFTRNPALGPVGADTDNTHGPPGLDVYDYGGRPELSKALDAHKTIADFNFEQQAEIVRDYKDIQDHYLEKARAGTLTEQDKKNLSESHRVYHPFVSQLAAMPGKEVNLTPSLLDIARGKLPTIDVTPPAPGLPDYSVKGLGVLPADPLLGDRSVPTKTPGAARKPVYYDAGPLSGKPVPGMVEQGNIDLNHRPQIKNDDGSSSTIFSVTVPVDKDGSVWKGKYEKAPAYALVPSIVDGKFLTPNGKIPAKGDKQALQKLEDAATDHYSKSGEHLGIFQTPQAAEKFTDTSHAYGADGGKGYVFVPSGTGGPSKKPSSVPQASGTAKL
jgi:hypothetical protein